MPFVYITFYSEIALTCGIFLANLKIHFMAIRDLAACIETLCIDGQATIAKAN